jgi:hypothetical protein
MRVGGNERRRREWMGDATASPVRVANERIESSEGRLSDEWNEEPDFSGQHFSFES